MKSLLTALTLGVILVPPVSAQTSKPMPMEQLAAYNKPDREKVLYGGAKNEGKITWYTSLAGESYKQLAARSKRNIQESRLNPIARRARK